MTIAPLRALAPGLDATAEDLLVGAIDALSAAIAARDPETATHSGRVARVAARLASQLGLSPLTAAELYLMGLLHDVGKIGVDDRILRKSGPLTPEEHAAIRRHVPIGVWILAAFPALAVLLPGVRGHHEHFDGGGYPDGLAGRQIPRAARVLAVADAFDAMATGRLYRRSRSGPELEQTFRAGAGRQWDPEVVAALLACHHDLATTSDPAPPGATTLAVRTALGRQG